MYLKVNQPNLYKQCFKQHEHELQALLSPKYHLSIVFDETATLDESVTVLSQ